MESPELGSPEATIIVHKAPAVQIDSDEEQSEAGDAPALPMQPAPPTPPMPAAPSAAPPASATQTTIESKHLRPPWTESIVNRDCPDMDSSKLWDGGATTAPAWIRETIKLLRRGGVDSLAAFTRGLTGSSVANVYGAPIDTNGLSESTTFLAEQLNSEREILIESGRIDHCLAVTGYIRPEIVDVVVDPNDSRLRTDPDSLWAAINDRIRGAAAVAGPKLQQELYSSTWATKGNDGKRLTYLEQAETMVGMYQRLLARFRAAPKACQLPETALVGDFCSKLPATGNMRPHIDEYRACVSLADLLAKVRPHAMDADASTPSGMTAFVATTESSSNVDALLKRISKLEEQLSPARRMDKEAGPIRPGQRYCDHHGWNRSHSSDTCKVLHPPASSTSK